MKSTLTTGPLVAALMAASGFAFETMKQQISTNTALAEAEHLVTSMAGVLEPCRDSETGDLIFCPVGQFVYRHESDGNLDCPCHYEMRHCDNEREEWDVINGGCVCVEQVCFHDNHHFDFDECACVCDLTHDCPNNADGHAMMWDRCSCSCVCVPEEQEDPRYTWNVAECRAECVI